MRFLPPAKILFWAFLAICLPDAGWTAVKLAPPFSDNVVLQRGMPVPVWGTAEPGEGVTVKFRKQEKTTKADGGGKWMVKLDALEAGSPAMLEVAGTNTLKLANVLVGDVWIGSGQSNMENAVLLHAKTDPALAEAAKGAYPHLRLLVVKDGIFGTWQEATPQAIAHFSALLFYFGVCLDKELNVPLGLIVTAQGGTSSEQWLRKEAYDGSAKCQAALRGFSAGYSVEAARKKYDEALNQWRKTSPQGPQPEAPLPPGALRPGTRMGEHFEANILPLIPLAFRGLLWDQGENGTGIFGVDQFSLMSALIPDWRAEWKQGDFPFIFMQKPSGGGASFAGKSTFLPDKPPKLKEGIERETYVKILKVPGTDMVITSDFGAGTHPEDKSDYARRAAKVAVAVVYGSRGEEIYGPMYRSFSVEGSKIRLAFDHVGKGLVAGQGDKLQGFAIAGEDRKFRWADALIEGNSIVVSNDKIKAPVAVRYAWSATPAWANLFNRDGLPALTFRTDDWTDPGK